MEKLQEKIEELGWIKTSVDEVYHKGEFRLMFTLSYECYELTFFDSMGLFATFRVKTRKLWMMQKLIEDWSN